MISLFRRLSKDKGHAGRARQQGMSERVSERASELSLAAAAAATEELLLDCMIGGVGG